MLFFWDEFKCVLLYRLIFLQPCLKIIFFVVGWEHKMAVQILHHFGLVRWRWRLLHQASFMRPAHGLVLYVEGKFCRNLLFFFFLFVLRNLDRKLPPMVFYLCTLCPRIVYMKGSLLIIWFVIFIPFHTKFLKFNNVELFVFLRLVRLLLRLIFVWIFT